MNHHNIGYRISNHIKKKWQLYLLLFLPVSYIVLFRYVPMLGVTLAFKDFSIRKGILGSEWIGLKYFKMFIDSPIFLQLLKNTLTLSAYSLVVGFPMPIILAFALNDARNRLFKKTVQMVTYAPNFISMVVMVGIIQQFLHPHFGFLNSLIKLLGGNPINFMGDAGLFRSIYVWSGIWQSTGFSAIIYIAALSSIDQSIVEAAIIDGANKLQRIIHVDLPSISPTIAILFILAVGDIMNVGFEKVYLLQNQANAPVSEIISTHVYKRGLENAQYSYATAVDLFNSLVNIVLITSANYVSKRLNSVSLW